MNALDHAAATAAPANCQVEIGAPCGGGFYAGAIRTSEGVFGIVAAPKAEGQLKGPWGPSSIIDGADSFNDGQANTVAMAAAGLPLAAQVSELQIGGFTDWYIPSRDELELLYRAFKPTTADNYTYRSGENPSALPPTHAYKPNAPAQTALSTFQAGGDQAFDADFYWSSTQSSRNLAWIADFFDGFQGYYVKSAQLLARAVRRFRIE